MIGALGFGWAVIVAGAVVEWEVRGRARHRLGTRRVRKARRRGTSPIVEPVGRVIADLRRRRVAVRHERALASQVPLLIDLFVVALRSGCTPAIALTICTRHAPPESSRELAGVSNAVALGEPLATAWQRLAPASNAMSRFRSVLIDATLGASVIGALERLADDERAALRRRNEARARTVPVRLLFPLVFLVLPAFGLITVVPALDAGLRGV